MEIASGYMRPEQVWQEAQEIAALFGRLHIEALTVFYGFGCDNDADDQYRDIEVKTGELLAFLSRSIADGLYHLAKADFYIESKPLGVLFLLCHESDVHLETEDGQVADYMRARWAGKEYPGSERVAGEWVPLAATGAPNPVAELPAT